VRKPIRVKQSQANFNDIGNYDSDRKLSFIASDEKPSLAISVLAVVHDLNISEVLCVTAG